MKVKLKLFFLLCLASTIHSYAQAELDSIVLLNGKVFRGTVTGNYGDFLAFNQTDRKGKLVSTEIATYRLFSYVQSGTETTVYKRNKNGSNYLSVIEARQATLGSYDARKTFKPAFVFWSSFALGYSAAVFDTYLPQSAIDSPNYVGTETNSGLFRKSSTIFPFFIPAVLTVSWGFPSFRIKEHQIIQKNLFNNESYYRGYHRIAKQKRMLAALKGSLIGIGSGMLTYAILK